MAFNWAVQLLSDAKTALTDWNTRLTLAALGVVVVIAYAIGIYAVRTDSFLGVLGRSGRYCRPLTNENILFVFSGIVFFTLFAIASLGELHRFFVAKRRSTRNVKRAALSAAGWGGLSIGIGVSTLWFFMSLCR